MLQTQFSIFLKKKNNENKMQLSNKHLLFKKKSTLKHITITMQEEFANMTKF